MPIEPHRLAEARSLAAHRVIAARLREDPRVLVSARERVASWQSAGSRPYAEAWSDLLAQDTELVAAAITADTEQARALRQCTPFAGVLDPRERWQLWAAVREELEDAARS